MDGLVVHQNETAVLLAIQRQLITAQARVASLPDTALGAVRIFIMLVH